MPKVEIDASALAEREAKPVDDSLPVEQQIVGHLQNVYDPELSVNVYDLGLIYKIELSKNNSHAELTMTLTSAFCPAADYLVDQVKQAALKPAAIKSAHVSLVMDPPWHKGMMSEAARLETGLL